MILPIDIDTINEVLAVVEDDTLRGRIAALCAHRDVYEFDDEMVAAGDFVGAYGSLADVFNEPYLTQMQIWPAYAGPAWSLLSHWSWSRGEASGSAGPVFADDHLWDCAICAYLEEVLRIRQYLDQTPPPCDVCHRGSAGHVFRPAAPLDSNGEPVPNWFQPQPWCAEPWTRVEPLVGAGGHCGGDGQVSDSFTARWVAPLADGTSAVITRYYYLMDEVGDLFIERQTEYLSCRSLDDPGGTETCSATSYTEVPRVTPAREDLRALAAHSPPPEPGEWAANLPHAATFRWE